MITLVPTAIHDDIVASIEEEVNAGWSVLIHRRQIDRYLQNRQIDRYLQNRQIDRQIDRQILAKEIDRQIDRQIDNECGLKG